MWGDDKDKYINALNISHSDLSFISPAALVSKFNTDGQKAAL